MGQGFESLQARHLPGKTSKNNMVGIVQRLERQIVVLDVVGSNPTIHPNKHKVRKAAALRALG